MSRREKKVREGDPSLWMTISSLLISSWDSYWYGPVAAIRPYLLMKAVLILLAFDLWLLRVPLGSSYGLDGFNVSHFAWLDLIQPLPTSKLYVGLVLSVGVFALICAFAGAGRSVLALLSLSYSYSWSMSILDGYQHHYFLSLVITSFIFFPRLRFQELWENGSTTGSQGDIAGESRNRSFQSVTPWGYKLLSINIALVYAFTALSKIADPEFLQGHLVRQLSKQELIAPFEDWLTAVGLSPQPFWQATGLGVIAVEIFLSVSYLFAVKQDEQRRRRLRFIMRASVIAALAFHTANELLLSLQIGWFSYYMIAFACVYFLPASFLWMMGRVLTWPARQLLALRRSILAILNTRSAKIKNSLIAIGGLSIGGMIVLVGFALDLPGAFMSGLIVGGILAGGCLAAVALDSHQDALRYAGATALATLLMWLTATQSMMRFDYYKQVGFDYQRRGNLDASIAAYEKAIQYVPPGKRRSVKKQ